MNPLERKEIDCTVCNGHPSLVHSCRECNGRGFVTTNVRADCPVHYPECPISSDPMVGGWYCSKCGRNGPNESDVCDG